MKIFRATLIASLTAICLMIIPSGVALSADTGGQAEHIDASGNSKPKFSGCYASAGGTGIFNDTSTIKGFMFGAGCDIQRDRVVTGGSIDYGFLQNNARTLDLASRIGFTVNPSTLAYAKLKLSIDGSSLNFGDGVVAGGVGLETYVDRNVSVFLEATQGLKGFGTNSGATMPTVLFGGVRYRF